MAKEIITVGLKFPGFEDKYRSFFTKASLMDADIVIFNANHPKAKFRVSGIHDAKDLFHVYEAIEYNELLEHWINQLSITFDNGKDVYFVLNEKQEFYLQQSNPPVKLCSTYDIINKFIKNEFTQATGNKFVLKNKKLFYEFDMNFRQHLEYKVYCTQHDDFEIIYSGKNDNYCLSFIKKVKNSHLIAIPFLKLIPELTSLKEVERKLNNAEHNDNTLSLYKSLIHCIIQIDERLNSSFEKTLTPDWAKDQYFKPKIEQMHEEEIRDKTKQVDKLTYEINGKKDELLNIQEYKDLLFETGKPLEIAINKSLRLLGYLAENFDNGEIELDGVIVSPEGFRYIGEYTAKDDSDIKNNKINQLVSAQLEDFDRDEIEEQADGLLFGNPQRLLPLDDRTLDFTKKCKSIAQKSKIALIKTSDLFFVVKYILDHPEDEEFKKKCREAIHSGLGKIVVFPTILRAE